VVTAGGPASLGAEEARGAAPEFPVIPRKGGEPWEDA
jgi:hypothetical protein